MKYLSKENKKVIKLSSISFVITIIIFGIISTLAHANPFFGGVLWGGDLPDEYLSFFQYLRHLLLGNWSSLQFSFSNGLGADMAGNIGYYLASPFNLIILLFPASQINIALYVIIVIKLGLASAAFAFLILKLFKFKNQIYSILLGIIYGLSAYSIGYAANLMWLDGVILLPLLIYSLLRGITKRKWILYTILLACAIIFNYYIGYMICIFMVLAFLAYIINYFREKKIFIRQVVEFALSSLISGLMSAVITLPTWMNLANNKLTEHTINEGFRLSPISSAAKSISALFMKNSFNGSPLLFVGTLAIIVFILYFIDNKNSRRERIINLVIGLVFVLSLIQTKIYLFWHGGQKTVGFPYRFSFIIIFWILLLAAKELTNLDLSKRQLIWAAGIYLALGLIVVILRKHYGNFDSYLLISLSLIVIFSILLYFAGNKAIRFILVMIGVIEIAGSGYLALSRMGMKSNVYSSYITENQQLFNSLPASIKKQRIAKNYFLNNDRGESYAFDYKGVEIFSSNNDPRISALYANLGLSAYGYYYFYKTGTIVTDAILNVGTFINSSLASQSISPEYISYGLRDDLKNNRVLLRRKQYTVYQTQSLPIAFAGNLSNNLKFKQDNPIYNQNLVLNSLTETRGDVLTYSKKKTKTKSENASVEQKNNKIEITRTSDKAGSVIFTYTGLKPRGAAYVMLDKDLMGFADPLTTYHARQVGKVKNDLSLVVDKKDVRLQPQVKQLVGVQADQDGQVQIKLVLDGDKRSLRMNLPRLVNINSNLLEAKLSKVNKSQALKLSKFNNDYLAGRVKISKDENLVTTIPYSNGWRAEVDGKDVKINRTLGVFIGLKMKPGKHSVVLRYQTPGLLIGALTSIIGIILLVIFNLYLKKKRY
ncbi:YfhO family protein [Lactobacillus taiwanensis]|uniref:YfhO family protein n=1 Tax=Lactobacillus taiwanensis TaxID=508451 RepID=UPI00241F7C13|nr:YfhO family protein [Lactobacillus taiwanensis]